MFSRSRFNIAACFVGKKMAEHWKALNANVADIEKLAKDYEKVTYDKIVSSVLSGNLKTRDSGTCDVTVPSNEDDLIFNSRRYVIFYDELTVWWEAERKQILPVKPPWCSEEEFNNVLHVGARSQEKLGIRDRQHKDILAVIAELGFERLKIPDGGKAQIKKSCLNMLGIFTDAGFDHAWKAGLKINLFKLENEFKYKSKKPRQ